MTDPKIIEAVIEALEKLGATDISVKDDVVTATHDGRTLDIVVTPDGKLVGMPQITETLELTAPKVRGFDLTALDRQMRNERKSQNRYNKSFLKGSGKRRHR